MYFHIFLRCAKSVNSLTWNVLQIHPHAALHRFLFFFRFFFPFFSYPTAAPVNTDNSHRTEGRDLHLFHRLSFLPVVPPPFHLISDTSDVPSNLLTSRLFCVSPSPCVRPSGCSYIFLCLCRAEILFSTALSSFFLSFELPYVCLSRESKVSHFIVSYSRLFLLKPFRRVCCNIFAPLLFLE